VPWGIFELSWGVDDRQIDMAMARSAVKKKKATKYGVHCAVLLPFFILELLATASIDRPGPHRRI
jgi:hypothetical protein